jgi:transposase
MAEEPTQREAELSQELARSKADVAELRTENKLLREKIDALARRLFGASSEKLDGAQLLLMMQGLDPGKAEGPVAAEEPRRSMVQSPPRSRERGARIPEHLPIVEEVIVPEPVKGCPEAWRCIGEEVTEQLDYEPARFFKRRIVRRKYVRADHPYAAPIIAPLQTLQDRCIGAPGLIAAIIVAKYCDHLPLYRQEQIFTTRHGIQLPRQTMAQWLALAAEWLRPIYESIRTGVLGGGYVQVDETPIEYLVPGNGETKLGYLWSCARPGGDTVFAWHTSRAAACLENIIPADFRGTVQSDGYAAYPAFTRAHNTRAGSEAIVLAGCWAHARRAILEASEGAPQSCAWLLRQIGALYKIEAHLRQKQAGPNLREAMRAAQSIPLLRRIRTAMLRIRARYLPQTAMAKAITYTLDQWPALERFAGDGHIEIDNNNVENAIRPTAVGKKNWLFIGAADAGQRAAVLYTIVESCRRRGLDPQAYLHDILTRLPKLNLSQIPNVTPAAWASVQPRPDHLRAAS